MRIYYSNDVLFINALGRHKCAEHCPRWEKEGQISIASRDATHYTIIPLERDATHYTISMVNIDISWL